MDQSLKDMLTASVEKAQNKVEFINELKGFIHKNLSPIPQPVDWVRWVPLEKVQANDYNPNSVATTEMRLLYTSILHDGYTQPVVTVYDEESDKYIIIDGFHRYLTCRENQDISDRNSGTLPIVVLDKSMNDRMASTVRHNRARGKHSVTGMSSMVFSMLNEGWSDSDICNELGMETEELLRLKHVTGFSKLFEDTEYKKSWKTKYQIKLKKKLDDEGMTTDGC